MAAAEFGARFCGEEIEPPFVAANCEGGGEQAEFFFFEQSLEQRAHESISGRMAEQDHATSSAAAILAVILGQVAFCKNQSRPAAATLLNLPADFCAVRESRFSGKRKISAPSRKGAGSERSPRITGQPA